MKKLIPIVIAMFLVIVTLTSATALSMDTYWNNNQNSTSVMDTQSAFYFINMLPDSNADQLEITTTLYNADTYAMLGVVHTQTINVDSPTWISLQDLEVSNQNYQNQGNYLLDVNVRQTAGSTIKQRSKLLNLQVTQFIPPAQLTADFIFNPQNPFVNEIVTFTDQSTADNPIVLYEWFIDGQKVGEGSTYQTTFNQPDTYDITLKITDNEQNTNQTTKLITVSPALVGPSADFSFSPSDPVVGEVVTFMDQSTQGDSPIVSYEWKIDGQEVSTSSSFSDVFDSAGNYEVTLVVADSNGLSDEHTQTITVDEVMQGPVADLDFMPKPVIEVGVSVNFFSLAQSGSSPIILYEWFVDGVKIDEGQSIFYSFDQEGQYAITHKVTDQNGLTDEITKDVVVSPAVVGPTANFIFGPQNPIVNNSVSFIDQSTQGDNPIIGYEWRVNGALEATTQNFEYVFNEVGDFDVTLNVVDSASLTSSITQTITVSQAPPLPQLLIEELGCNANVVQGNNQHCSAYVTADGVSAQSAQVTFKYTHNDEVLGVCQTNKPGYCHITPIINEAPGTYEVYAVATKTAHESDDSKDLRSQFTVLQERYEILALTLYEDQYLTENYTFYRSNPIYAGFSVRDQLTGEVLTPNTNLISEVFIRVNNDQELQFEQDTFTSNQFRYYLPMIPLSDDFLGEGQVFSFVFNFSDNTAGQDSVVVNILNNPITFNPPSKIQMQTSESKTIDFKQYVQDIETPNDEIVFTFENLGDIELQDLGNNIFSFTAPDYAINQFAQVTADDNDGSTETRQIIFEVIQTVFNPPIADFSFSPTNPVVGEVVTFMDQSIPGDSPIVGYEWRVDGVVVASTQNFDYEFTKTGSFDVELSVIDSNGLSSKVLKNVVVSSPLVGPSASFSFSPSDPVVGETVAFMDQSTPGDSPIVGYEWFVDGVVVSASSSFSYIFDDVGSYEVMLVVTDSNGLFDGISQTVVVDEVIQGPLADFDYLPKSTIHVGIYTNLFTLSQPGSSPIILYEWFANGVKIGEGENLSYLLTEEGPLDITHKVTDQNGLFDEITKTINVSAAPVGPSASFSFSPSEPMVGETVAFVDESTPGDTPIVSYEWRVDNQLISTGSGFGYKFDAEGNYTVSLTVTDSNGLFNETTQIVQVSQIPAPPQLLIEELGCNANVVQGNNQYCSAFVTSNGEPVEGAQIEFTLLHNGQFFASCITNFKGYCSVSELVNLPVGTYEISATAQKPGYESDNSMMLTSQFNVWEQRYDVHELKVFSDMFITEEDTFFRGEEMYASFKLFDTFTGQYITNGQSSILSEVFIRVNNMIPLNFNPLPMHNEEFRYYLPMIPLSDDFLGEGQVFSFVFNFSDNTAGQDSVVVNILNNPLIFNPPGVIQIQSGSSEQVDFKQYVQDIETPSDEIIFTFENLGDIELQNLGNNVFEFTAQVSEFNQTIHVTADDTDGSTKTRTIILEVTDTQGLLGPVAILSLRGSALENNPTTLDASESFARSGQIIEYKYEVFRFGQKIDEIVTTQNSIQYAFSDRGAHQVVLTVTDSNQRQATTTNQIDIGRNTPDIVIGDYEGLHITNIVVYGVDDGILDVYEPYTVYATVTNHRDERINDLRLRFQIPELGFTARGASFSLAPGESLQRSIVGYLPLNEADLFQDDFIVTVGVSGSGFNRNKYIPVDIGTS